MQLLLALLLPAFEQPRHAPNPSRATVSNREGGHEGTVDAYHSNTQEGMPCRGTTGGGEQGEESRHAQGEERANPDCQRTVKSRQGGPQVGTKRDKNWRNLSTDAAGRTSPALVQTSEHTHQKSFLESLGAVHAN
jgi:hypothetical protein